MRLFREAVTFRLMTCVLFGCQDWFCLERHFEEESEFASSNKVWKTSLGIKSSRKSVLAVFLRVCFKRCGRGRPRVQAFLRGTMEKSENND